MRVTENLSPRRESVGERRTGTQVVLQQFCDAGRLFVGRDMRSVVEQLKMRARNARRDGLEMVREIPIRKVLELTRQTSNRTTHVERLVNIVARPAGRAAASTEAAVAPPTLRYHATC